MGPRPSPTLTLTARMLRQWQTRMLSLCSCAHASCLTVAETVIVWPTVTGVRARCAGSCEGDFIIRVFLASYTPSERSGGQLAPQPPQRSRVATAALPAGAPGSGATSAVPALRWAPFWRMNRRLEGGCGGRKNMANCTCTFVARMWDSEGPA